MTTRKEIPFSDARRRLTDLVNEVERTGGPVTIVRHGKAVAVLIGVQEYQAKFKQRADWKLAGSLTAIPGADIDAALDESRKKRIRRRKAPTFN